MKQLPVLCALMARVFIRSWAVLAPLGVFLGAYTITFFYSGNKVEYFAAVGGFDMALVCAAATLALAGQVNRAMYYPVLARLPARQWLIVALGLTALAVTAVIAALFVALAAVQHTAEFTPVELLTILPRWLGLWVFALGLALHLSRLAGHPLTRLAVLLGLIAVLLSSQLQVALAGSRFAWLLGAAAWLASPVLANMLVDVHGVAPANYLLAVGLPLCAGAALAWAAARYFTRKDLHWAE